ncbi:MAG: hypothetical protein ABJO14_06330 [Haloferula sp.]|uniref:hypothetical protein n=1 Tax=Haloferula sp. TaxID=2497595 RepID=UPI00329D9370
MSTVFGHQFDPVILENVGVYGDVPRCGYVELENRYSISIEDALCAAGFDVKKLKTAKRPYPFEIKFFYIADRTPDTVLELSNEGSLRRSLATNVEKGVTIEVTDFERVERDLKGLKDSVNVGWEVDPLESFERLRRIVSLESRVFQWKNPGGSISEEDIKSDLVARLTKQSHGILHEEISRRIAGVEEFALNSRSPIKHVVASSSLRDLNEWVGDENLEKGPMGAGERP